MSVACNGKRHRVFLVGSNEPWQQAIFSALARYCDVIVLEPVLSLAGWIPLFRRNQPCILPRGIFSHRRWLVRMLSSLARRRLLRAYGVADALIITDPFFWPYALHFRDLASVIAYHVSDDYSLYPHVRLGQENLLAHQADLIFTVSLRLADVLRKRYGLDESRFRVIPNGIPASWLPAVPPACPTQLPELVPADFRPMIGVIGVIGSRIDLLPIVEAHDALPQLRWLFVGPVRKPIPGLAYLQSSPRCLFLGAKPYETLQPFFAALDAAVLPLTHGDINPCSSPVRFFSQLPTGQPILYTGTCDQLTETPELVYPCVDAKELIHTLARLAASDFRDGRAEDRYRYAVGCTWERRAAAMALALSEQLAAKSAAPPVP